MSVNEVKLKFRDFQCTEVVCKHADKVGGGGPVHDVNKNSTFISLPGKYILKSSFYYAECRYLVTFGSLASQII